MLVANTWTDQAPPPPPGMQRIRGNCAICGRAIAWLTFDPQSHPYERVVCGSCAHTLLASDSRPPAGMSPHEDEARSPS